MHTKYILVDTRDKSLYGEFSSLELLQKSLNKGVGPGAYDHFVVYAIHDKYSVDVLIRLIPLPADEALEAEVDDAPSS